MSPENQNSTKTIHLDDIIQKFLPVIGILLIVSGFSYLFYTGVWGKLDTVARLALGFITSIALIGSGVGFKQKLKYFADVLIGGGVILLYITLIFGSRFESAEKAVIPEVATLVLAAAFSWGISYFSFLRKSKVILVLGILGGYLTPFFMGKIGVWEYSTSFAFFLIYFLAVNVAVFWVSVKHFFREILLLNSVGLFVGTYVFSVQYLDGLQQNVLLSSILLSTILILNILAVTYSTQYYKNENSPYLLINYCLPFIWFVSLLKGQFTQEDNLVHFGLYMVAAAAYFFTWYLFRDKSEDKKHFTVYFLGFCALILGIFSLTPHLEHYNGLIVSGVAIVFAILNLLNPFTERKIGYLILALTGFALTNGHLDSLSGEFWIFEKKTLFSVGSLLPFLIGLFFSRQKETQQDQALRVTINFLAVLAGIMIVFLLGKDIFNVLEIPLSFIVFTLPAMVLVGFAMRGSQQDTQKTQLSFALVFGLIGYLDTFLIQLSRIYPYPNDLLPFSTETSFLGFMSTILLVALYYRSRQVFSDKSSLFFTALVTYVSVLLLGTHEFLAFTNLEPISSLGILGGKAFALSLWWIVLSVFLIYMGIQNSKLNTEKALGLILVLVTLIKVFLYDLTSVDMNLKIIILIFFGVLLMGISYFSQHKKESEK